MAKEYGTRRSSRSRGLSQQFLVITITFLLGYITASFFDIETISRWITTQVLAHHEAKVVKSEAEQPTVPPKPKFEFYTLLANEKVQGSQPATVQQATATQPAVPSSEPAPAGHPASNTSKITQPLVKNKLVDPKPTAAPSSAKKVNYLVQVASFKVRQDAEQMKGGLILKGFNVYIVPVSHPIKGNWFRVVVGPYPNQALAQEAQVILAKNEHLNGMIIK
jgi:cell division protein FtsN